MPAVEMRQPRAVSSPPLENEKLAALAKALGRPARLRVVRTPHARRTCIGCDIGGEIGLAQSTTSEHLRILKAAGIIAGEVESPRVCYALNTPALASLRRFLDEIAGLPAKSTKN